ncbi:hypothetical protein [Methylosinus sp. Sm6]|uniref:hypothetical protein n=1 Tax=Methylosinus sp. Sm6 TaxID=2866948 RepID=UPI001C997745|nr:hypothetical protein [Methylosinus sp. Sm6]MBY6239798.1 hypothetical protein [Methylosinus sp. Sm6]
MNILALAGVALFAALFLSRPASSYFVAGGAAVVFGPVVAERLARGAISLFGHAFLLATSQPAKPVATIALAASIATAAITGAVSAGYAAQTLPRQPGDVLYLPTLAVRADGRLALADGVTIAEAARAYAGPGDYWSSTCRAALPGWRSPVDWEGVDATGRPLWRATISDHAVVTVDGLGPAEADPLRALLAALAPIVACGE